MFTSRSAIEAYQECNRYRYNQYFLLEKGVVRTQKSVPLVTGAAVHRGVEHCLNRVRLGQAVDVDTAVHEAVVQYVADVEGVGFIGKNLKTDKQQWFTFNEQKALVEALIRAWCIAELPQVEARYKVLAVEREIEPIELAPGVLFQSRVDAEFQEKETGDYHNYSLKTCSQWNERMENSYKSDLQGVTEVWAVEEDAKRSNALVQEAVEKLNLLSAAGRLPDKNLQAIREYLSKRKVDRQISGIRFCFLVKGTRKKPDYFSNDPDALMITYNPLIRGYKRITPSSVEYAHSWFYPNPENKSGKSALGRGWEPFNVWEEMGVKEWFEMIPSIQPECGDIIKQQVVTPVEYFRNEREIEEAMGEIREQEGQVLDGVSSYKASLNEGMGISTDWVLQHYFPHNRKHCDFHFGGSCEYKELCWSPEVTADPLRSGLYQIREPHHEAERNQ
jgi:hypothetical protein